MADANSNYSPYPYYVDPDFELKAISKLYGENSFNANVVRRYYETDEGKAFRAEVNRLNDLQNSTVAAIKVAYTGTTADARLEWIKARIRAIQERATFIDAISTKVKAQLVDLGSTGLGDAAFALIKTVITTTIPLVGGLAVAVVNNDQAVSKNATAQMLQDGLIGFANDMTQLQTMYKALGTELINSSANADPTNNAATAWPIWYYFVGAGIVILFLMWLKTRRKK